MLLGLLIILVILWFLGYIHLQNLNIPNIGLFIINGQKITLWDILTLLVVMALIGILPRPFREIAGVFLIIWILSVLGIIAVAGLSSLLVIAIIVGLLIFLLKGII